LDEELLGIADSSVKIPLRGEIESLNAAVASAVISFEILSQEIEKEELL